MFRQTSPQENEQPIAGPNSRDPHRPARTRGAIGSLRLLMSQAFTDLAELVPVGARTVIVHGVTGSTRQEVAALLPEASIHDLSDVSDMSGSGRPHPAPRGFGPVGSAQPGFGSVGSAQPGFGPAGSAQPGPGSAGPSHAGSGPAGSAQPGFGSAGPSHPGPGTAGSAQPRPGSAHPGPDSAGSVPRGSGAVGADLAVMEVGSHIGQARIAAELFELADHMREGAVLLVVTARRLGSARQLKTLDRMFGAAEVAHRSGSAVVLRAVRGPVVRATADATTAAPTVEAALLGHDLRFETGVGLFSKRRIDAGTRLLLEALPREHGWRDVLDLGCGYGPIGIAVASRWPQVRVAMADIDPLAVRAARTNAQINGVDDQCEVYLSDGTAALSDRHFDAVLSHLPTHVPRSTLRRLLGESQSVLQPGGELIAVTAAAVDLRDPLGSDFNTVRVLAESRAGTSPPYRVVQAAHTGPASPAAPG